MKVILTALVILTLLSQTYNWNLQSACYGESPRDLNRRYELLKDVPIIQKKQNLPGQVLVYGQSASVIVAGDSYLDVLIGATQLNNGRIVIISHDNYLTNFIEGNNPDANIAQLHKNIKKWVTQQKLNSNSQMIWAQDYINLPDTDANPEKYPLIFTNQVRNYLNKNFTQEQKNKIVTYVKNGGGLVVSVTPWGWASLKGTSDFNLMLTYKALAEGGLTVSDEIIWKSPIFNSTNPNAYLFHIGKQLDLAFGRNPNDIDDGLLRSVSNRAKYIPEISRESLKNRINDLLTAEELKSFNVNSLTNRISSPQLMRKISLYLNYVLNAQDGLVAPGYQFFPGPTQRNDSRYILTSKSFSFVPRGNFKDFYHTGYYAEAGQKVTIEIIGIAPINPWRIYIGFHTDNLNNAEKQRWLRWPQISKNKLLNSKIVTITSPFGGMIFFQSPQNSVQTLNVRISNILEAQYFNSQDANNVEDWSRRVNSLAPWGVVEGKWVGFHMPYDALKTLDKNKLMSVLNLYDKIYESYHSLRGTDPSKQRKQYVAPDIQITVGYMHSGYPIGTMLYEALPFFGDFLLNEATLRSKGIWGIYHELGHNVQQAWWTPQGTVQVTCNIFTLRAIAISTGNYNPLFPQWVKDQLPLGKQYLSDVNQNYTHWKSHAGIGLLIYVQVIADYGWSVFEKVFSSYQIDTTYPNTDQQKIDTFWAKVSIAAKTNMVPLLTKWKIPYTENFTKQAKIFQNYVQKINIFNGI